MKLIIGLGNPGLEYENTKHNIGFKVVDWFCGQNQITLNEEKFNGIFYKDDNFIIAKPMTYMNLSGNFVQKIVNFYKIKLEDILIIYDEIDLEIGQIILKKQGSSNGQKGIDNIINTLKTNQIARLKIGVGRYKKKPIDKHVLSNFTEEEEKTILKNQFLLLQILQSFIKNGIDKTLNDVKI